VLVEKLENRPEILAASVSPDPFDQPGDLTFRVVADDPDGAEDLRQALLLFWNPAYEFVVMVRAVNNGGGNFSVTFRDLDGLEPGLWTWLPIVEDRSRLARVGQAQTFLVR
jgi:hypothetical protein